VTELPDERWQPDFIHWHLAGGQEAEIASWLVDPDPRMAQAVAVVQSKRQPDGGHAPAERFLSRAMRPPVIAVRSRLAAQRPAKPVAFCDGYGAGFVVSLGRC
jgi:hypothetical protein